MNVLDISHRVAWKIRKDILKYADVDYYGDLYIKQGSIENNEIIEMLAGCFFKFCHTL